MLVRVAASGRMGRARSLRLPIAQPRHIQLKLSTDGLPCSSCVGRRIEATDELLERKGNQDTENDDSDLADEGTPAVQWLW